MGVEVPPAVFGSLNKCIHQSNCRRLLRAYCSNSDVKVQPCWCFFKIFGRVAELVFPA